MEPRSILQSMARRWWIFLTVLLITVGATYFLTMQEIPIYRTRATYIVRLSNEITDAKTTSTALDSLNRYDELQGTYSEIAMSQKIKREAGTKLGVSGDTLRDMTVSSRTVPGSKILEISVEGKNPGLIHDFAEAVGEATTTYVNNLYPSYKLTLLDAPNTPNTPIRPRVPFNLVLGTILGIFLGLVAALLSSWLRGDLKTTPAVLGEREEASALVPLKDEIELLLRQCELIRAELNVTRELIFHTESEARALRTTLNGWPENGHTHGKGKKAAVPLEEENETGHLEHESKNQ